MSYHSARARQDHLPPLRDGRPGSDRARHPGRALVSLVWMSRLRSSVARTRNRGARPPEAGRHDGAPWSLAADAAADGRASASLDRGFDTRQRRSHHPATTIADVPLLRW